MVDRPAPPAAPAWLDELDAAPGPPFLAMGLRPLGGARWPEDPAGPDAPTVLAAKRAVLAAHRDDVVAARPGTGPAVAELAALLGAGPEGDDDPAGVLARLAGAVVEDLCLLVRPAGSGPWVLGAGAVCFPSHWRLADKLGRPVAAIHGPVPRYAPELAARVDRFLDRLAPGRPVWRRNWLVHVDDRLYAPVPAPAPDPPIRAGEAGERLWLRSERQTLCRLAASGAVAFTIRTSQAPLGVLARRPALRARLAAAVASWPTELVAYRGGEAVRGPLLAWLAAPDGGGGRYPRDHAFRPGQDADGGARGGAAGT